LEWLNEKANGLNVRLRIIPRASKNEIQGVHDGALKVRLTSPPIDGKANQALIKFMSKTLSISKTQIELIQGQAGRLKIVRITGISKRVLIRKTDEAIR